MSGPEYRVGDEVTIKAKIVQVSSDPLDALPIYVQVRPFVDGAWLPRSSVATHAPAPRPIEVGDQVYWGVSPTLYCVVCISENDAWIKRLADGQKASVSVGLLRHADEEGRL